LGLYPWRTLLARTQEEVALDKPSVPTYNLIPMGTATMEGTLYLVPVGRVEDAILNPVSCGVEEAFGTPAEVAPALPHPSYAYDLERDQYLADCILKQLTQVDLQNAFRILGVVDLDLYVPQLNFVFGQASLGRRAALIALPRLRQEFYGQQPEEALFEERAIKEAIHELGHTLGLAHCSRSECVMCFSNSLLDVDGKSRSFCPTCLRYLPRTLMP
jgi:archaemetzincin